MLDSFDPRFWLPLFASALSAWYQFLSYRLARQQQKPPKGSAVTAARRPGVWLPAVILVVSLANWIPYVYSRTSVVTTENVQGKVRQWLDAFHLASQELQNPEAYFTYVVTLNNGGKVVIQRLKAFEKYLVFTVRVTPDKPAQTLFESLDLRQRDRLKQELVLDLSRARVAMFVGENLSELGINTRLPITPTLTEAEFIGRLDEMDFAMSGAVATLNIHLPVPIPPPTPR